MGLLELLDIFFNPKKLPDRHAERQQDIKELVTKERQQS